MKRNSRRPILILAIALVIPSTALGSMAPAEASADGLQATSGVLAAFESGGTFVDDDQSVHQPSIEAIAAAGITKGCNPPQNSRFCPDDPVKRGEMATMLSRALHLAPSETNFFRDDDGHTHESAINRLARTEITRGCDPPENTRFCPDDHVTRGAMAAFLARALDLNASSANTFVDDDGHIFEDAIQKIAAERITAGCNPPDNDKYCPNEKVTRAQLATFLTRALDLEIPDTPRVIDPRPPTHTSGSITGKACPCIVSGKVELKGSVDLQGELVVKDGTLVARPGVTVDGNGHEIVIVSGGRLDFQGTPKSGWVEWGQSASGWEKGDRLAVAPIKKGDFKVRNETWTGSWSDVSPSKDTLVNGTEIRAEVANLTRDITIVNVSRIIIHGGAKKQTIKHVAVVDSGVTDELGFYPIHFHLGGKWVSGSVIEGVVVEGGKNHAFVPHGVTDVTFTDVVAVETIANPFWWDFPERKDATNNSDNVVWKHALVLGVVPVPGERGTRLSGFTLGAGIGNECIECHAAGVQGDKDASAFIWPEFTGGQVPSEGVWEFRDSVGHNNVNNGIFVWQNVTRPHLIEDSLLYRNGKSGVDHGAYVNTYTYRNVESYENEDYGFEVHAFGRNGINLRFEDISSDGRLMIGKHNLAGFNSPTVYRRIDVDGVDIVDGGDEPGLSIFHDSNLRPNDFDFIKPHPDSVIRIYEQGDLIHVWSNGSWK